MPVIKVTSRLQAENRAREIEVNDMAVTWEAHHHPLYLGKHIDGTFAKWFVTDYFEKELNNHETLRWFLNDVCD
jgi:hypothetical protein